MAGLRRWLTSHSNLVAYVCCFGAVGYSWWVNDAGIDKINVERAERTDQACRGAEGGYKTEGAVGNEYTPVAALMIGGKPIYADKFFYHDVFATMCTETLFRANLGGDADFWAGDGSMWNRTAGYDGKDAFVAEYMNYVSNNRLASGCLKTIATDYDSTDIGLWSGALLQ